MKSKLLGSFLFGIVLGALVTFALAGRYQVTGAPSKDGLPCFLIYNRFTGNASLVNIGNQNQVSRILYPLPLDPIDKSFSIEEAARTNTTKSP